MNLKNKIIKKYIGIPYKHGGRSLIGLDCYGLIILVYKDLGFDVLDLWEYAEDWYKVNHGLVERNYEKQWIKIDNPQLWDVILIKLNKSLPDHCGLYIGNDSIMHITEKSKVVIDSLVNPYWKERIYGYFRFKGRS